MDKQKEAYLTNYVLDMQKESIDATFEQRESWEELWSLYQGKQNYGKKESWQSKIFVPKIPMAVEQATSTVARAVMNLNDLFNTMAVSDEDQDIQQDIDKEFKGYLEESNFTEAYSEHIKPAILLGASGIKCLWEAGQLTYYYIDPKDLWVSPEWGGSEARAPRYTIERREMDLAEFKAMSKAANTKKRAVGEKDLWDESAITKIEEDFADQKARAIDRASKDLSEYTPVKPRVELLEYWGSIIGENGKLKPAQLLVIANQQYVIRSGDNPFDDQKPPYILTIPRPYPGRGCCGESLVANIVSLQYSYNNVFNMYMDNTNFTVNKMFEIDTTRAINPKNLSRLYPGKAIHKQGAQRVMEEIPVSPVGQDAFNMLEVLNREIERGTAVTEFVSGQSGKTKTAYETKVKTAQSQGIFETMARTIEKNSLKPLLEMSFSRITQYVPSMEEAVGRFKFFVGGLSQIIRKQDESEKVQQALGMALQSPDIKVMTNTTYLWKKLLANWELSDAYEEQQPLSIEQGQEAQQAGQEQAQEMQSRVQQMEQAGDIEGLERLKQEMQNAAPETP